MSWSAVATMNAPPPAGAKGVPAQPPAAKAAAVAAAVTTVDASTSSTSAKAKPQQSQAPRNNKAKENKESNGHAAAPAQQAQAQVSAANGAAYNNKEKSDKPLSAAELKLQAEIDAAAKQIQALKQQLETLSGELKIREKARGEVMRERNGVSSKLKELTGRKNKLFDAKKTIRDKVKQIHETRRARDEQIRDAKAALKIKKVADSLDANLKQVDDEVAKLEQAMETQTLSIQEEKARVAQIAALRKTKDEIRAYHALVDSLTQEADSKLYSEQIRALDTEINSFKGTEQELQKQLDRLRAKLDSKEADVPALVAQRRALHADLDAAHQAQTNARTALQKLRRDLYNQRQAARAARDAENKAYFEQKKADDRKRAEQREAAELLVVPLADEIALCDSLIKYLAPYRQRAQAAAAAPAAPAAAAAAAPAAPSAAAAADDAIKKMAAELGEGVTVLQSNKRPAQSNAAAAAKKAENKRAAAAARQTTINHNFHTFAEFEKLGLLPPGDISAVEESLKQLQKKKADYQQKSAEQMAARAAAIQAKKAAAAAAEASGTSSTASTAATTTTTAAPAAAAEAPANGAAAAAGDEDGELLAAFKAADKDASGFLDTKEFSAVLSKMAQFDTADKVAAAVAKADANGTGKISYVEFVKFASEDD